MADLTELTKKIIEFRDARNWKQFHNPKDMALSLLLEASELVEHFQWKNGPEIEKHVEAHRQEIAEELADILYWVVLIGHDLGIDLIESSHSKLEKNALKYPLEKAKNSNLKYTQL